MLIKVNKTSVSLISNESYSLLSYKIISIKTTEKMVSHLTMIMTMIMITATEKIVIIILQYLMNE